MRLRLCLLTCALWLAPAIAVEVPNGGFETDEGWLLDTVDGAEGLLEYDAVAQSGARSLKLTKTNGRGYLHLHSAAPIAIEAAQRYRFRGAYRTDRAPIDSLLLFRISPTGALSYNSIDRSAGWTSQSLLVPTPPDEWARRVVHYEATEPTEVTLHVMLWGNPTTVWLDDLELTAEKFEIERLEPQPAELASVEAVEARLAARENVTAEVRGVAGRSHLLLNGESVPPIFYKAQPYSVAGFYQDFHQAGIDLATVSLRFGTLNNKPGVWTGADEYDFALAEATLRDALRHNPDANLILDLAMYAYPAWGEEHPEELWVNGEGQRAYGFWGNVEGFADDLAEVAKGRTVWWYPSYQSRLWRDDAAAAVRAVLGHLRQTPYWKAVAGCFISGGHDGQFVIPGGADHSPATRAMFRTWLATRYDNIAELNRAWGTDFTALATVELPPAPAADRGMEPGTPHRVPGPELDHKAFRIEQSWALRDEFGAVIKEAAGKPIVTITYGSPGDHFFEHFRVCENIDAAGAMSYYPYRNPGYASEFIAFDSYGLHDKLFFQELDLRSWVGSVYPDEVYQAFIGAGLTPATSQAIHRKVVGISLAGDHGFWYYDMHAYFADPAIMAQIEQTRAVAERLRATPGNGWRPEVVLVRTGDPDPYHSSPMSSVIVGERFQRMLLNSSGVPYETQLLDDILANPELQTYKVYLFLQNVHLTAAQREGIDRLLKRKGNHLVWIHDTGYVTETGKSVGAMTDLIGMQVATEETYARLNAMHLDQPADWLDGVPPTAGTSELLLTAMTPTGGSSFVGRYQPFWVEDPAATPLMRYAENDRVAAAAREFEGWTSLYFGAPNSLDAQMLNNLARHAGAYVAGAPGPDLRLNDRFISFHGRETGDYAFRLPPGRTRLVEVDTAQALTGEVVQVPLRAGETRWYYLQ